MTVHLLPPFLVALLAWLTISVGACRAELPPHPVPADEFFADEVWAKVGARDCLKCHKAGGDAEDSKFVLRDPLRSEGAAQAGGDAA